MTLLTKKLEKMAINLSKEETRKHGGRHFDLTCMIDDSK